MLSQFATRLLSHSPSVAKRKTTFVPKAKNAAPRCAVKPFIQSRYVLTRSTLPPNVLQAQYAVRGPLVVRAVEIEKALKKGERFPFSRVTYCNVRLCLGC